MTDLTHLQTSRLIWYRNNGLPKPPPLYECSFLLDNGYHCVPDKINHCVVCYTPTKEKGLK